MTLTRRDVLAAGAAAVLGGRGAVLARQPSIGPAEIDACVTGGAPGTRSENEPL